MAEYTIESGQRPFSHSPVILQEDSESQDTELIPRSTASDLSQQQASIYASRIDSDSGSEVDIETQARQLRAREKLEELRAKVLRTRRLVRKRRGNIRKLQEHAKEARIQFMRATDQLVALSTPLEVDLLGQYYQRIRDIEDELGPAEDTFELLERRLDNEEQDLDEEEDYFYRHHHITITTLPHITITTLPNLKHKKSSNSVTSPFKLYNSPPPLAGKDEGIQVFTAGNVELREYLKSIKNAENLKQELERLEVRRDYLLIESNFRKSHDILLATQDGDFLNRFPERYRYLHDELYEAEDRLYELRDQCLSRGLFTDSEYVYESRDTISDELLDLVDHTRERSPIRGAKQRLPPKELDTTCFDNKRAYVNRWLMEWVEDSTVERLQLRAWIYFECRTMGIAEDQWPELSLQQWDKDKAGENTNESYEQSRLDAIPGDTRPTEQSSFTNNPNTRASREGNAGDVGARDLFIMSSEAAFHALQKEPSASLSPLHTPTKVQRSRSI